MKLVYTLLMALLLVASGTLVAEQRKPTEQEELARVLYYSYGITDKRRNWRAVAYRGGHLPMEI